MEYLEKPKSYWYWVKSAVRMCFPMRHDFYGIGEAVVDIAKCIGTQLIRLLLLILFPLAIPILSYIFWKENNRVMKSRAKRLIEEWDGFPAQYTK